MRVLLPFLPFCLSILQQLHAFYRARILVLTQIEKPRSRCLRCVSLGIAVSLWIALKDSGAMSFSQSVDEDTLIESTNADEQVDDGGDDEGALQSWKQVVFQRPCEAMIHLELFESGGYEHLLVLNLQQNAIHDLSPLISVAPTLRVLNVSQNAIAQLPHADFWRQFQNLTMCLLEQNRIHRWEDMQGLRACCSALLWLTLDGNPIMSLRNARPFVVNKLPFLKALDAFVVTDQEFMKEPGTEDDSVFVISTSTLLMLICNA